MLETILSNINSNLERIANHLESKNEGENTKEDTKQPASTPVSQSNVRNPIPAPMAQPIPTANPANVQAPVAPTPVPQMQVPVSQPVEGFTQEQIAVAMSNASVAGRQDLIQTIFNTFKVNTFMGIKPENYNQVATMLREAGIQV